MAYTDFTVISIHTPTEIGKRYQRVMSMNEKQEFWNVFAATGRVEDYLRYCRCADGEEDETGEDTDRRTDPSGNTGGRSG